MMNKALALVVAFAVVLTGCAGAGARQSVRLEAASTSTLERCEDIIYRPATSEADTALRCASLVGVWQ